MKYHHQETGHTCACACMRMAWSAYGIEKYEMDIEREMGTTEDIGTTYDQWRCYLEKNKFRYSITHGNIIDSLKKSLDGISIVHVTQHQIPHYAVVVSVDDEKIVMNDPAYGEGVAYTIEEFLLMWSMHDVLEEFSEKCKPNTIIEIKLR